MSNFRLANLRPAPPQGRLAGVILELLFPGRCLLCGRELAFRAAHGEPLCLDCRDRLAPLAGRRRCAVCSLPLLSEKRLCTRCRKRQYEFEANLSLFEYRDEIRELLYQYKFRNRLRLAGVLAGFYAQALQADFAGAVLVPAPANPQAVRRRGWDPVERICRVLEARFGFTAWRALSRRPGPPQKLLGYEERLRNLRGTLRLRRRPGPEPVSRKPVLGEPVFDGLVLVDDVFTTGATASECARLLRLAGASRVRVLTLAIDVP
jgi:ComF family protein